MVLLLGAIAASCGDMMQLNNLELLKRHRYLGQYENTW